MNEKILTISIAAYNAAYCIEKCINSLIKSKYIDNLEIIVVDDGSSDNLEEVISTYLKNYDSIIYIKKENGGHGSTINTSIKRCTGKYFKIVDADDWVETDNLDKLVEYLKDNDEDLVINPYYQVNASNGEKLLKPAFKDNREIIHGTLNDIYKDFFLQMHMMTFKSEVIKKMGPIISEKCFYVDSEYTIFPIRYINTVTCFNYPIYDYLIGTSVQSMDIKNLQKRRDQHLKVTKRLVNYYNDVKDDLNIYQKQLIYTRICLMVSMQYCIYVSCNPKEIFNELKEFDNWLKENARNFYDDVFKVVKTFYPKRSYFLSIFRKINFFAYVPTTAFLQKLNLIKN